MKKCIVIGGGAAGFFAAIALAEHSDWQVTILERGREVLQKVKISGGGRCNVTNALSDPALLVQHYPRGARELLSVFRRFGTDQTRQWYEAHGVALKTEADGRVFPHSNRSQSIVDCLVNSALQAGVQIRTQHSVEQITAPTAPQTDWKIQLQNGEILTASALIVAGGSSERLWQLLAQLGHRIVEPVPSLFTFSIAASPFSDLSGISVQQVQVWLKNAAVSSSAAKTKPHPQEGALLFTHKGVSGPAVLRLSAWEARTLHALQYRSVLCINFLPALSAEATLQHLQHYKQQHAKKQITALSPFEALALRLWQRLCAMADIDERLQWANLPKQHLHRLVGLLRQTELDISGKNTFKEEFVTCGGVALEEVNFKTLQSRLHPTLYFAGEILDIDAITGGFNFQAAWATAFIAGTALAKT